MIPPSQFVGFVSRALSRSEAMRTLLLAVAIVVTPTAVLAQAAGTGTVPISSAPAVAHDHKRILVLYSTRRDAEFSIVGEDVLPKILDVGLSRDLDYYSEFIDVTRFPDPSYRVAFGDFIRLKYTGIAFDLVIAMGDVATAFVDSDRVTLFQEAQVVFLANNPDTRIAGNSSGFILERNFTGTLRVIEQLQPDVKNVFVVTGAAPADRAFERLVRAQLTPFESRFSFTYLTALSARDLEQRLARLPEHSVVYYVLVTEDATGDKFHPLEFVDRVTAAANRPTYSWVDSSIDHGILGGDLYVQKAAIERVGGLALRVLHGERADSIATSAINLNVVQVDWRQLQRWGIDEARIPAGAFVMFREPSLWDRYKTYILGAAGVLLIQFALIAGLLVHRVRRYHAERELRTSQEALQASYERLRDLGGRLLHAQESERARIARELHDDISQQVSLLVIDLGLMRGDVEPQKQRLTNEALSRAEGIVRSVHDLSHRLHPPKLRLIGLVAALRDLQHEMSQLGVPITFTHESVPMPLPLELTLCLFRVVQEAVQNAHKYSHARHVSVHLRGESEGLTLTVSDDGVGFDVDEAWGKGLGLISMDERLEAVGGTFKISSKPDQGTTVRVFVPLSPVRATSTVAV
jgi:signal transduction histidine kinase